MNMMGRIVCALALAASTSEVLAIGLIETGKIVQVRVDKSGRGYVLFDRKVASPANCVYPNYPSHMSFDTNTTGGRSILGVALAAQSTGSSVAAAGTGTCEGYGVMENISEFYKLN